MGVSPFQPIAAERSVVKLSGDRADKRVQRWQEIVQSACEQCGRNTLPQVLPILSLNEWLQQQQQADARLILLSPLGTQKLADIASAPKRAWPMAGHGRRLFARARKALRWTPAGPLRKLGPRILVPVPGALAAVAAVQAVWGGLLYPELGRQLSPWCLAIWRTASRCCSWRAARRAGRAARRSPHPQATLAARTRLVPGWRQRSRTRHQARRTGLDTVAVNQARWPWLTAAAGKLQFWLDGRCLASSAARTRGGEGRGEL